MFQFPGCPPLALWIHARVDSHYTVWVPPFGYPRICARLQLPEAFRSWPRPSSAYGALASTLRSSSLDFFVALLRPIVSLLLKYPSLRSRFPSASTLVSASAHRSLRSGFPFRNWPSCESSVCSCQGASRNLSAPENDTGFNAESTSHSGLTRQRASARFRLPLASLAVRWPPTSPC